MTEESTLLFIQFYLDVNFSQVVYTRSFTAGKLMSALRDFKETNPTSWGSSPAGPSSPAAAHTLGCRWGEWRVACPRVTIPTSRNDGEPWNPAPGGHFSQTGSEGEEGSSVCSWALALMVSSAGYFWLHWTAESWAATSQLIYCERWATEQKSNQLLTANEASGESLGGK